MVPAVAGPLPQAQHCKVQTFYTTVEEKMRHWITRWGLVIREQSRSQPDPVTVVTSWEDYQEPHE